MSCITDGYVYKSGTAISSESSKFQRMNCIQNISSRSFKLDIKELQVIFTMTKSSVIDYNQPYVWSLQLIRVGGPYPNETPLNHNFQPNMEDSSIVAVGIGNINNNKFPLYDCKIEIPPNYYLFFVIEPEDKSTGVTYYTEIIMIYDNYWY